MAINILWASVHLLKESYDGIVDKADPEVDKIVRESLDEEMKRFGLKYHGLRHRRDGVNIWLEFHILFEDNSTIKDAHDICTKIEDKIDNLFSERVFINTHLEPMDAHDKQHPEDQHA